MSIALTTHKVAAAAIGVAMVFSFAFVTPAQAQSVESLTAQINSLLATISSLQAQLAGISGGTSGGACYTFTENHKMGDSGGEVMNIQKYLNQNGYSVAASGAGSPGNESSYFGALTKAAVVQMQNANAAAILAPVGLTNGTGYWGSSSRAFANANCTAGTGTGTTPTVPTGTGLSVSAVAQPANGLAVEGAARIPFTKFAVTNNSGSAQTINSVTVQRGGLLNNLAFDGVVLLDQNGQQIGNSRVINSNDQASIGESVTLQPGETRTFTVAGNMKATLDSYAGQIGTLSVIAINTSATVAGSLPITGASHTVNANLAIGSVTAARGVEDPNGAQTKETGTTGYTFTAIKLTAGSAEDVRLHSVRFDQSGSASASDMANVMAYVDGTAYSPVVSNDTYTFNFGGGIVINEGLSKEIVVKGDIVAGTNRTIAFDVYRLTDIYVTGETYGYGATPSVGSGFQSATPVYDASVVTISAGSFNSVSKSNAAPASNIAKQKSGEILGAFNVDIKGEGVTVQTLNFDVTVDDDYSSAADPRAITNVTLVDQNGAVLGGPVDSSAFGTSDAGTTGNDTIADALTFSNVRFPVGVTTLYVKGQLDSDWAADDTLAISTDPNTDWSDATGDSTGDTVTLPSSTATANTMTIKAATFTATTLSQPVARTVVAGATDFVFSTFNVDAANSGEDVRVSAVVLEDTASSTSGSVHIDNVEIWANLSGGSTNDSTRGDRFETRVADAEQFTGTTNGDNTLSITLDTHVTVAKNTSVDFAVVADLSSSATVTTDTHTVSLDQAANAVTAVGLVSGSTITGITPSGAGQAMTVGSGGTLTVTVDSSSPSAKLLLDNGTEQTTAVFRFAANNVEDLDVDSIKLTSDGTDGAVAKYVFYHGATKLGEVTGGQDTAELFLADGALTVPANGNVLVTVKVVPNNIDGTTIVNGNTAVTTISAGGDVDTTGKDSGTAVDSTQTDVDAATHTLYEAYPVIAFDNSGVSTTLVNNTNHLIAKLQVTNPGDEDVTFASSTSSRLVVQIANVSSSSDSGAAETLSLRDVDGNVLDSDETFDNTTAAEVTFDFNGAYTAGFTVPAGGSKTMYLYADTSDHDADGDSLQVWLDDTAADLTFAIDGSGAYAEGDIIFRGDIFGPVHINPS